MSPSVWSSAGQGAPQIFLKAQVLHSEIFSTTLSLTLRNARDCMASGIEFVKILPPQNCFNPVNSPQGIMSPLAVMVKKQRPPPQGEMSHINRRATGAMMARRVLVKLPTMILWLEVLDKRTAVLTALIKQRVKTASSGFNAAMGARVNLTGFIKTQGTFFPCRNLTNPGRSLTLNLVMVVITFSPAYPLNHSIT